MQKCTREFRPGPLNFIHTADTCVMKAVKPKTSCLLCSLSDDILYESGWFITLLICLADLMRELYLTATVDKLLSRKVWDSFYLKRKINSDHCKRKHLPLFSGISFLQWNCTYLFVSAGTSRARCRQGDAINEGETRVHTAPVSDTWMQEGSKERKKGRKKREKFWSFSLAPSPSSSPSSCICPRWIGFSDLRKCTAEIKKEAHLSAPE